MQPARAAWRRSGVGHREQPGPASQELAQARVGVWSVEQDVWPGPRQPVELCAGRNARDYVHRAADALVEVLEVQRLVVG